MVDSAKLWGGGGGGGESRENRAQFGARGIELSSIPRD